MMLKLRQLTLILNVDNLRGRTSKISDDIQHANYCLHGGLYDTEVVQRIVYLNLRAA